MFSLEKHPRIKNVLEKSKSEDTFFLKNVPLIHLSILICEINLSFELNEALLIANEREGIYRI